MSETRTGLIATEPHIRVRMLSQARYLCGARDLVSSVAKRLGFDDMACGQIALAVDEALCNVIRHGYDRREDGLIWLSIWPVDDERTGEAKGIKIVIDDNARQIDPDQIRGRDLDDIRPGGLGVYIMKNVMNVVEFEKREEGGMRLVLIKNLDEAA